MALSNLTLDWLLVISCSFSVLLTIIYLFYSNRILACIIGYAIRLTWWNDECSRAWVSLESFQVSALAGRILIKDLKYHSSNQSFRAIKCRISWRYWAWRTRGEFNGHVRDDENKAVAGNFHTLKLPCRIHITLEGVEWHLYNRTASYDNIAAQMQKQAKSNSSVRNGNASPGSVEVPQTVFSSGDGNVPSRNTTVNTDNSYNYPPPPSAPSASPFRDRGGKWIRLGRFMPFKDAFVARIAAFRPGFHEILPIGVTARHGAIVCGNPSTPSFFVSKFANAEGSYSLGPPRTSCDLYKTIIDFRFKNVKMDLQKNPTYRGTLVQHGKTVSRRFPPDIDGSSLFYSAFFESWDEKKRHEAHHKTEDVYARTQAKECETANDYAVVETILEAPGLELSYYWDELGEVPMTHQKAGLQVLESPNVGNGYLPPQYGIDLVVRGGTTRYGPWADRQRVELQRLFFPPTYQVFEPSALPKPGDKREYTDLKIFIELCDTTTFHIPFKESSKDWQYDEAKFPGSTRKKREGGWLEVCAGGNSTITYTMPWVATANGFGSRAELHLEGITTLSSVNDIQLLTAESSKISCELPVPLAWNEARSWTFDVSFQKPTFYLIRDHINLLTDLGKDWSSGLPADFDRWIPMHYVVHSSMQDFELNLFLNDHNIITHPHAREANSLLTLRGATLSAHAEVPSTTFRPEHTTIPFWIEAPGVKFSLTLPKWNTHSVFATSRIIDFAHIALLKVDATFLYHSETRPDLIDELKMDGLCREVVFLFFGWVIRHLMTVRDNYFGNFTHFSTLSEYVAKRNRNQPVGDPVELKWREGKSNLLQVSLGVRFEDSILLIPTGFPGYEHSLDNPTKVQQAPILEPKGVGTCVVLKQPELQIHLRTHDCSMEMSLNISPVALSVVEDVRHSLVYDSYRALGRQKLHIDGINIVANRLFGPQPRTSTYLCLWEIQIGTISGVASTMELRGLSAAFTAFRLNYSDDVNAPAKEFAQTPDPDVTFLRVSVGSVEFAWIADHTCIYFSFAQGANLDYNDLPGENYNKITEVRVRQGSIRALICSDMLRASWLEAGSIRFDVGMDIYTTLDHSRDVAEAQMNFVAAQDALTRRASFLYEKSTLRNDSQPPLAYRFSMFLPRPSLPRDASVQISPHARHVNASPRKPKLRPVMYNTRPSDSEEDVHISEADRDARLAHSRPATPSPFNKDYDSHSISSSDESDNDGVTTDMSDSDSDGPEEDQFSAQGTETALPALSHYKYVTRRFESNIQENSTSWNFINFSLFSLVRDITPVEEHSSTNIPRPEFSQSFQGWNLHKAGNDASSTIRLLRSNLVDVLITPLCLHVVREISEEALCGNQSMEMLIDSLTTTYLKGMISENRANHLSETFDIEVSIFRLRILQSILAVDDSLTFAKPVSPLTGPPVASTETPRILSDLSMSLYGLSSTFTRKSPRTTLRASFSGFAAAIDSSVMDSFSRMSKTRNAVPHCTFFTHGSMVAYTLDSFYVKLGDVQVRLLENFSPVMVAATVDSLTSVIQLSQEAYKERTTRSVLREQGLLWGILQYCQDLHVDDPLSQIQPSFLVQVGFPLRLRFDASWRLFMYLRHCLRHLNPLNRQRLQQQFDVPSSLLPVEVDGLFPILSAHLLEWGNELPWEEIERLPFLRYCFSELNNPRVDSNGWHIPLFSFYSGTFTLAIIRHSSIIDNVMDNTMSFGPLQIAYNRHKQAVYLPLRNASEVIVPPVHPTLDPPRTTFHHILTATVERVSLTIHPTFIVFLQHLVHLNGNYLRQASSTETASKTPAEQLHTIPPHENFLEIFVKIPAMSIQAAVETMVLEVGFAHANCTITLLQMSIPSRLSHKEQQEISGNFLLKISQLYTQVRQPQDQKRLFQSSERDILTSLIFSSVTFHVSGHGFDETSPSIKGLFSLGSTQLSVPRSALITYRRIEEWRTQYLPNIHSMTQALLKDLGQGRKAQSSLRTPKRLSKFPMCDFQISVKQVGISLQVMHGTWFSWDVHNIMLLLRNTPGARRNPGFNFGVQLASQIIRIGAQTPEDETTAKTVKLALPSFRSSGTYDGVRLRSHAIIDHFSLTLKPRYMDDILVVQQNLGTHFYDVLDLVAETRRTRPAPKRAPAVAIKYDAAFMLQGFRVGIVGPTTILDLTSAQMTGTARNEGGLAWDFSVSNLALALSHHSTKPRLQPDFDRKLRSAYMVLDLKASSSPKPLGSQTMSSQILRLQIDRMHAVMSPNSVGELGDLIDHFQAEKLLRQEQRAQELKEIKNKTKRVMRTFEVEKPTASLKRSTFLLDNRTVLINIADIGIAFPSALREEVEVDAVGSVPAFLMSIQKANFSLKRHESGQASIGRLSFQFVKRFDQSRPSQFDGDKHTSRNRLLYPGMKAEFQSGTSTVARQWQIGAYVYGFVLDLDPSIVDNVFELMDVYRKGRERVERLTSVPEMSKFSEDVPPASIEASYHAVRTSNILLTLVFHTGKVRLRDIQEDHDQKGSLSTPVPEPISVEIPSGELDEEGADVIFFPQLTVWGEYRATPAASKLPLSQDQEPSILIFRSQLHTTNNCITPSLFPFLTGISERVEHRLRRPESEISTREDSSSETSKAPSPEPREFLTNDVLSGMQLSFSLSIDSSRLELECGHGLGVMAALHWESGGFIVTLSPKSRVAYFAGSVNGLQVDLRHVRHQGGMVQTARVDARNLAFSVSYGQTDDQEGVPSHSISVVLDTEFGAALRLDRLQDILIFKAIYVDRLPGTVPQRSVKTSPSVDGSQGLVQSLKTAILVRARHIKFLVDLGHNVASAVINLETLLLRSRITESSTDVALSIAKTSLDLEDDRPLAGYMRLPDFSFTTVRRNDIHLEAEDSVSKMLEVTLTSGTLDLVLQSERRTILQYHAKPFDIRIADDWAAIDWDLSPEDRTLRLDFSVVGTNVLAIANLQTIPKIIILLAKLKADVGVQKTEAGNALATSSITQLPRPENALSEVADAMIRSARSKFHDVAVFSYVIVQHMTLRLSNLRFALFKNPNDMEMAMFQGIGVNAELQRVVQELDMPPTRILKLSFSALNLSKYTSLKYRVVEDDLIAVSWLENLLKGASQAIIARVPAMNLEMDSDVEYDGQQEVLLYDLVATADERAQASRSIYVSLNLSLYIWAGGLVKGLGAEIEKALTTAGFNKPAVRAVATSIAAPPTLPSGESKQDTRSPEARMTSPTLASEVTTTPVTSRSATSPPSITPTPSTVREAGSRPSRRYHARSETSIDYGTIQQLGEATPDAKAPWLGLKETVPPRVHEYATLPMEVLMKMLLEVYSKQLRIVTKKRPRLEARGSSRRGDITD